MKLNHILLALFALALSGSIEKASADEWGFQYCTFAGPVCNADTVGMTWQDTCDYSTYSQTDTYLCRTDFLPGYYYWVRTSTEQTPL